MLRQDGLFVDSRYIFEQFCMDMKIGQANGGHDL
jgi:hypothetical protein